MEANYSEGEEDIFITQNAFGPLPELPSFDLDLLFGEIEEGSNHQERQTSIGSERTKQGEVHDKVRGNISRKIVAISDQELEKVKETRIPYGTKVTTNWCVNTWYDWAVERNGSATSSSNDLYTEVEPDVLKLNDEKLNYWLSKFVVEIRKKSNAGEVYPPSSLYQLCCGIQRHFRENGRPEMNIFESPVFNEFQKSLDAESKRLTSMGVGATIKQAEAFTEAEEEQLWTSQLLGGHSAEALLDTMLFLIGKNFSLRSGKEHRNLSFSQLTLVPQSDKEPEKLVYCSFGEKNNPGGLKHRSVKRKRVEHYINNELPERCLVHLFKKYVSKCPKGTSAFYLMPKRKYKDSDEVWFTTNPVGHNTLANKVKRLCEKAGIEGNFTNHSLRATTATRGLTKGIPDKYIMERTGHRDPRSLQKYQRPDVKTKDAICKSLECGGKSWLAPDLEKREHEVQTGQKRLKDDSFEDRNENAKKSAVNITMYNCSLNFL